MTEHLGGPENDEKTRWRHQRYLDSRGRAAATCSRERSPRTVISPARSAVGSSAVADLERSGVVLPPADELVALCTSSALVALGVLLVVAARRHRAA